MSSSFRKSFLTHLTSGGVIGILYLVFSHNSILINRIINSLFLAGFLPLVFGGFRFVKSLGMFDLFVYSHRKLWKYGKRHEKYEEENEAIAPDSSEKLGSYYEYLSSKEPSPSCKGPILAGGLYLALSLILTFLTL